MFSPSCRNPSGSGVVSALLSPIPPRQAVPAPVARVLNSEVLVPWGSVEGHGAFSWRCVCPPHTHMCIHPYAHKQTHTTSGLRGSAWPSLILKTRGEA